MKKKKCVKNEKKKVCEKRKKKRVQNWLGYCPTVSQYNGKLYRDTSGFGVKWDEDCIAAWGSWVAG